MSIPILVAVYVLLLAAATLRGQVVLSKQSSITWEKLVASLFPIRTDELIKIATALSNTAGKQARADFSNGFTAIGGLEGLRRVQCNAVTLMALAAYIEMWSVDANADAIALMRQDGLRLRRTVIKLELISKFSRRYDLGSRYLSETAKLYYGMVERLLLLCEVKHVARYPGLVAAVNW